MSSENQKKTLAFICPGCLTSFRLDVQKIEGKVPKCDYCGIPLERVKDLEVKKNESERDEF